MKKLDQEILTKAKQELDEEAKKKELKQKKVME